MISLKNTKLDTKINNQHCIRLQKFIDFFYRQIQQQVPGYGCVLIAGQNKSPNIIEALCLSDKTTCCQYRINYTWFKNLELNIYESESEIYCNSLFLGYIYLINKTHSQSRYLILFYDQILDPEQKQIITTHNQLLQQYLDLENQYQEKETEVQNLKNLLYQIGHHLKTPLAEISMIAETICLSPTIDFCQLQAKDIKNKIINLNLDLKTFLTSFKKNKQTDNIQDIRNIFQETINDLKHLVDDKNLKIKYPKQTVYLTIDNLKLKQIFDNLLSNAIYFSPPGETIYCSWQSFQKEILVNICDRGSGLSLDDQQNMFLPFYSRRENGQGLGLTIVKKIILDLKGNIWSENIYEGGTKIAFVIPKDD